VCGFPKAEVFASSLLLSIILLSFSFNPVSKIKMSEEREIGGKGEISDQHSDHESLIVSEDEALARARNSPNDALPLRITFGPNDPDNPRCWGYWRKWYITCFVSMLNVITYASLPLSLILRLKTLF
jgi:hypothetical protein